jgi:hypothetical protein
MKIKDALGCTVIMKEGNHDERLRALIYQKAPELFGLPEASLEFLVRERADIDEWVCDKRKVMAGRLNILHGHELPQGVMSPVNIARGLYLRTKANSLCGHHHRSSYHAEMTLDEDMISCWSAGCFCHMKPNYMPINSWNHGGAIVTIAADGKNFTVDNVRIKDGRVL